MGKDRFTELAAADAAGGWQLIPLARGKKGTQEEQAKVMATAEPEHRDPLPHQTALTKRFVPTGSQIPQFFHQCLRAGNLIIFIIPCSQLASAIPDFPTQTPVLPHLPRYPHVLCIPHIPPGSSTSCLQSAAHHNSSTQDPPPTTPRQGQCPYTAFSGHLQICKQAGCVVSSFADLQVSA